MRVTHVPGDGAAVRAAMREMFTDPPGLDAGADRAPLLPSAGGVAGTWLRDPGHDLDRGVTVYVHGGGFAYSNPPLERVMAYRLARATGRPAFAVDYRLAPAHPFPAAVEDVVAVYRALLAQGVPAGRIVLAGESAGGTLVLSALLVLAAAGDPLPAGAVPVSPIVDFAAPPAPVTPGLDSIDPAVMGGIAGQYLAGARPDQAPQSPLYGDLRGLPPLLLAVGGDEVLLGDAQRFAEAAAAAGVAVDLDVYGNMPHAFHACVLSPEDRHLPTATAFLTRLAAWTRRLPAG